MDLFFFLSDSTDIFLGHSKKVPKRSTRPRQWRHPRTYYRIFFLWCDCECDQSVNPSIPFPPFKRANFSNRKISSYCTLFGKSDCEVDTYISYFWVKILINYYIFIMLFAKRSMENGMTTRHFSSFLRQVRSICPIPVILTHTAFLYHIIREKTV